MRRIYKVVRVLIFLFYSLVVLEGGSRAVLLIKPIRQAILKGESDAIWREKWVRRHNKQQEITLAFDEYDSTRGWKIIPNISNMPCFKNKVFNSNSRGIRGNREHSYAKDEGTVRILFLGDSFTFGEEVSDTETYPDYLQQMLPNVEVINMGVHGYGHDQMLIYLKEEGIQYQPDVVFLGFLSVDGVRNMLEFRDYAKPRFKLANNMLELCNTPVPTPEATLRSAPWRSKFLDLLSILKDQIYANKGLLKKEQEALTDAILREIVFTSKKIGAVPIFLYLDTVRSNESNPGMTQEEEAFLHKCESIGVKSVFFRQLVLSARLSGLTINKKGHFDPETNKLIALGIKEYLLEHGFLDGSNGKAQDGRYGRAFGGSSASERGDPAMGVFSALLSGLPPYLRFQRTEKRSPHIHSDGILERPGQRPL